MDGWMDGWTDGWTDGWMDGWMDGLIDSVFFFSSYKQETTLSEAIMKSKEKNAKLLQKTKKLLKVRKEFDCNCYFFPVPSSNKPVIPD